MNPKWHGESIGFTPDYWSEHDKLFDTIEYLTGTTGLMEKYVSQGGSFFLVD